MKSLKLEEDDDDFIDEFKPSVIKEDGHTRIQVGITEDKLERAEQIFGDDDEDDDQQI